MFSNIANNWGFHLLMTELPQVGIVSDDFLIILAFSVLEKNIPRLHGQWEQDWPLDRHPLRQHVGLQHRLLPHLRLPHQEKDTLNSNSEKGAYDQHSLHTIKIVYRFSTLYPTLDQLSACW